MNAPSSRPYPLGVTLVDGGANVAVYSESAEAVDVAVFDESGAEQTVRLDDRDGHVFHGVVAGMGPGTRYGLRVHGPWAPERGLRYNAHKPADRPVRQGDRGRVGLGRERLRPHLRRPGGVQRRRLGGHVTALRRGRRRLRLVR
ncbi:hypothetical protein GCM10025868_32000 [Angustibacter aerolatus]|uniref:Glycoside hydrolase family 13 N-terminal domain-containing protein n=1 Tax=Angustibacter aerolatus TaxID=1162965 RepID=A0ABQ6JL18_9ACTN|nr:hypothetical protein [Angustibacter aerolatus]GMA87950.1 hypothetical protein GCM10025868_32000 [Angustibacter aerolatus]